MQLPLQAMINLQLHELKKTQANNYVNGVAIDIIKSGAFLQLLLLVMPLDSNYLCCLVMLLSN
jgi:hypothetical protein